MHPNRSAALVRSARAEHLARHQAVVLALLAELLDQPDLERALDAFAGALQARFGSTRRPACRCARCSCSARPPSWCAPRGRTPRWRCCPSKSASSKIYLGANIGIAVSFPGSDAAELLDQAGDARIAAAARPDKVSHAFASTSLDARAHDYIRLASDLHDALDAGAPEVWFQPKSPRSHAIVASVVTMAHALGLRVVGEGIETQSQFDALEAPGCDEIQGDLISRPLPTEEITAFLVHARDEPSRRTA